VRGIREEKRDADASACVPLGSQGPCDTIRIRRKSIAHLVPGCHDVDLQGRNSGSKGLEGQTGEGELSSTCGLHRGTDGAGHLVWSRRTRTSRKRRGHHPKRHGASDCIPTMPCTYGDVRAPRFTQVAHGAASVTAMGTHQMYA